MSSPIVPFRTQQQVATIYTDAALAINNALDLRNPGDWFFKANAIGSVGAGLSQDMYILQKQIFAQTASGSNLDSQLAALNLTPRQANLPATGLIVFASAPGSTVTVAQGQIFTYSTTNVTYQCTQTTVVTTADYATTPIPIACTQLGTGFAVPAAAILTVSAPIGTVSNFTVQSMSDGVNSESDSEVAARIIFGFQNPAGGGSAQDFIGWAMQTSGVTLAQTYITIVAGINQINVVIFGGSGDPTTIINTEAPGSYTRAAAALIPSVTNYIQSVRPINNTVVVTTTETYLIPNTITVFVTLIPGYTLSTNVPTVGLTVQQLIQREVRRDILSVPPGGITVDNAQVIPMSLISQTLDAGLSASAVQTGIYAGILIDRDVIYNGNFQPIPLPSIATNDLFDSGNGYAKVIYDVQSSYSNVNVVLS